jgi:hypothetical protein
VSRLGYRDKNIRNVPETIKRALLNHALANDITMADAAGQILGIRYGVAYVTTGRKSQRADATRDQLTLSVPPEILDGITGEGRKRRITESSVVLLTLAEYFGLMYTPTRRGRRLRAR